MIINQNNSCYICNKVFNRRAFVDHCHNTGKVRKLLCNNCNLALGNAKDNIEILKNMINYLEEHSA